MKTPKNGYPFDRYRPTGRNPVTSALTLEPLDYHRTIVAYLRGEEAKIWEWAAAHQARGGQDDEMRALLLRETYRLDAAAHPEVHEDCRAVLAAFGLDAPVTLYQAADGTMNAALYYLPGEIHIVFHGPVLEKLSRPERIALIGHEMAHYRLWSIEDGVYRTATTILDHALAYPGAAPSHVETARMYRLHTELYADRGGAIAVQAPGPPIATLVKTLTGLINVDAGSYLRQAAEIEAGGRPSEGDTHPEIYLRASALDKWWCGDPALEPWLAKSIRGSLAIAALDLPRQIEVTALTRGVLARLASDPAAQSEAIVAQLKRFFPDWGAGETPIDDAALVPERLDTSARDYLIALSFDLAMADPDSRDAMLLAGARLARSFDGLDLFRVALKRDLGMTRQAADRLLAPLGKASK